MDNISLFLDYIHLEKNYSPRTIREYRHDLSVFKQFLKKRSIAEATKGDIRAFLSHLKIKRQYSENGLLRKIAVLRSFFKFCVREGIVYDNPMNAINTPKTPARLPVFLTDIEAKRLIDTAYSLSFNHRGKRNYTIIMLFLSTGLRVSELIDVRVSDIESDGDRLVIRVKGKGNKERMIPLRNRGKAAVEAWLRERRDSRAEHLFFNPRTYQPITSAGILKMLKDMGKRAGITKTLSPHKLRHTFATDLIRHDVGIERIQDLLGHVSLDTTRIYTHITTKDKYEAIGKLSYN